MTSPRAFVIAAGIAATMTVAALGPKVASASSGFATVGKYTITPNPVAAPGSLQPGQVVHMTVTAFNTSGARDAFAYVWVVCDLCNSGPTGKLTVASTCLQRAPFGLPQYHMVTCKYQVNMLGQLAMTYTALKPPASYGNYDNYIYASRFSDPGVLGSPWVASPYFGEA